MHRFFAPLRLLLCALALLAPGALSSGVVSARTALLSANPAPGSALDAVPAVVSVTFAEPLAPGPGTALTVYDGHGQVVSVGAARIVPDAPQTMRVAIHGTGPGTYVVVWQMISAADRVADHGVYAFTVGMASAATVAKRATDVTYPVFFGPVSTMPPWFTGVVGVVMFLAGLAFGAAGRHRSRRQSEVADDPASDDRPATPRSVS